ncbi:hypothetical protein MA16_Dca018439 [Dendrobium catenatum]|uniref:Uncharacterized protein n=1 Tax=Dendrobium catenatum TaxID=906689 RepID=A0A2I0XF73_9ASPA|nr:hypothetical protein MA16_Dca018439 [Dendrobium catenatum]
MMGSRSPSDVWTGGRPEVLLRVGRRELSSEFAQTDRRDGLASWGKLHLPRAWKARIELEGLQICVRWKGKSSPRACEHQADEPQPLEGFGSGLARGDHQSLFSIGSNRRRPSFGSG